MKDKRLELKLSVRGDSSLSRNSSRSSTRSNRNEGLPVSEFFAIDRFHTPYDKPVDILRKYGRHTPNHHSSLQDLDRYNNSRRERHRRRNPYDDGMRPYDIPEDEYSTEMPYRATHSRFVPYHDDPRMYGSLPRSYATQSHFPEQPESAHYTLPTRKARRVRISEVQPTIHDYGKWVTSLFAI